MVTAERYKTEDIEDQRPVCILVHLFLVAMLVLSLLSGNYEASKESSFQSCLPVNSQVVCASPDLHLRLLHCFFAYCPWVLQSYRFFCTWSGLVCQFVFEVVWLMLLMIIYIFKSVFLPNHKGFFSVVKLLDWWSFCCHISFLIIQMLMFFGGSTDILKRSLWLSTVHDKCIQTQPWIC